MFIELLLIRTFRNINYVLDSSSDILLNMFSQRLRRFERHQSQKAAVHTEIKGPLPCESRISRCHGECN